MGCHFLLQRIFPTQELNLGLLHCRQTLYRLSYEFPVQHFFCLSRLGYKPEPAVAVDNYPPHSAHHLSTSDSFSSSSVHLRNPCCLRMGTTSSDHHLKMIIFTLLWKLTLLPILMLKQGYCKGRHTGCISLAREADTDRTTRISLSPLANKHIHLDLIPTRQQKQEIFHLKMVQNRSQPYRTAFKMIRMESQSVSLVWSEGCNWVPKGIVKIPNYPNILHIVIQSKYWALPIYQVLCTVIQSLIISV